MNDPSRTNQELLEEISALKQRIQQLEQSESERKSAEVALRDSEERFSIAFRVNPAPMVISTVDDGVVLDANDRFLSMIGYSRDELIGKESSKLQIWVDYGARASFIKKFFKDGFLRDEAVQVRAKNGEIRDTLWSAELIKYKGREVVLSLLYEITERKHAEEALRESEKKYRTIVENINDAMYIHDLKGNIIDVNENACRMLGYERDKIVGANLSKIDNKWHRPENPELERLLQEGHLVFERENIRKDGSVMPVEVSVKIVHREGENFIQGFVRDITDRKRLTREIETSREQLRLLAAKLESSREEERTNLAREIHDELGQSLTALKLDLAWLSKKLPKEQAELLVKTKSMQKLLDGNVKLARDITTRLRPAILDDFGLLAAIEWQASDFGQRTGIKCLVKSNVKKINLSEDRSISLFRIFQEALTNIVKHSKASRVDVNLIKKNSTMIIEIQDNGKGIKKSELQKKGAFGILGIRERVSLLRGALDIDSLPGKGTTLRVTIQMN
jgi:PAS domain S-box-containing protein